ncbi:NAD-dependent epimerase/dehydratase family protein [Candidatus Pacearchaeota archaeon]|nr:NAD-dependent epimerase/dehydratase family protein [Candidatus Pacearchaeota archaeon]
MNKILITGGTGFIGTKTANRLVKEGYEVRVFDKLVGEDRRCSDPLDPKIEVIQGDLFCSPRNKLRAILKDVSQIFHFASYTETGRASNSWEEPEALTCHQANSEGTRILCEEITGNPGIINKIILASSRVVYGEGNYHCGNCKEEFFLFSGREHKRFLNGDFRVHCTKCDSPAVAIPTKEDGEAAYVSVYGSTKYSQEQILQELFRRTGIPTVALRYFNVYGPGAPLSNPYVGVLGIFFTLIRENRTINLFEQGSPIRDLVHIDDVVEANLLALKYPIKKYGWHNFIQRRGKGMETFNIGSGMGLTLQDSLELLMAAYGKRTNYICTNDFREGDIHTCIADLDKSKKILGWKPSVFPNEGFKNFVDWAKTQESDLDYKKSLEDVKR